MRSYIPLSILPLGFVLVACGGGGGGSGGNSSVPQVPFTTWSAIQPNTTTVASGSSQELSYLANPQTDKVTSASSVSPNQAGAQYFVTTNSNNDSSAITLKSALGTTVTFNAANGSALGSQYRYFSTPQTYAKYTGALTGDGTSAALAIDPLYMGWNYQGYGVWITGRGTGSGTAGVMSIGAPTIASNVPTAGAATFSGNSAGLYLTPVGDYFITTAAMTANVSFTNRTVNFSTVNTSAASAAAVINGNFGSLAPSLDLKGNLSYAAGSNNLNGTVTSASSYNGNPMTGTAAASFYGPNANEIGGTFALTGTGAESYAGAFGGKR